MSGPLRSRLGPAPMPLRRHAALPALAVPLFLALLLLLELGRGGGSVTLPHTADLAALAGPAPLVVVSEGGWSLDGRAMTPEEAVARLDGGRGPIYLAVGAEAPAARLVAAWSRLGTLDRPVALIVRRNLRTGE